MLDIKVKYHDKTMPKLEFIGGEKSNWIDLYTKDDIIMKKDEFKLIDLGVSIELPKGYEAHLIVRSSTYKKYGLIQTNSMGIIDNAYCGNDDVYMLPVRATKNIQIPKHTRIAQFRAIEVMGNVNLIEVEDLSNKNRGGFGSTGN